MKKQPLNPHSRMKYSEKVPVKQKKAYRPICSKET